MIFHSLDEDLPASQDLIATANIGAYGATYTHEVVSLKQQETEKVRQHIEQWLRSCCHEAMARGISTEFDLKIGDAGSAICDLAKGWEADLIVIGRRGRTGLSELLLGSVSNYVLHHAPCSVLVIQH